jgi:post-segregation antitoxin (ccd killing protein)
MSKDYEDRTKDELQDEARRRDLPVSGTKQEIIDRLSEAGDEQPEDREDRTKDELQDEARRRGLPVSGKKQEIIDRLTDADEDKGGEDNGDDEQSENREDRTKDELQDEARRRGLPVSGRKQELLDRLADADLEEAKEEDEDDSEDEDKSEDDVEQEDKDAKDEGETEDGEEQRSPSARPSRRTQLKPMQLAQRARRQLSQLTGHSIEAISGLEPDDGNWRITLELVELARVPRASDVLGSYEVVVDADGDLLGYRRLRRYVRGAASED